MLTNVKDVVKKLVNTFDTIQGHTFQNDQDDDKRKKGLLIPK